MIHAQLSIFFVSATRSSWTMSPSTVLRPIILALFMSFNILLVDVIRRCVASAQTLWEFPMRLVTIEVPTVDTGLIRKPIGRHRISLTTDDNQRNNGYPSKLIA